MGNEQSSPNEQKEENNEENDRNDNNTAKNVNDADDKDDNNAGSEYDSDDWETISSSSFKKRKMTLPVLFRKLSFPKKNNKDNLCGLQVELYDKTSSPPPGVVSTSIDEDPASPDPGSASLPRLGSNNEIDSLGDEIATSPPPELPSHPDETVRKSTKNRIQSKLLYRIDEEEERTIKSQPKSPKNTDSGLPHVSFWVGVRRFILGFLCAWFVGTISLKSLQHAGVVESDFDIKINDAVIAQLHNAFEEMAAAAAQYSTANSVSYLQTQYSRPGYQLAQHGASAYYPIVMIPGFVTSGLEVWGGKQCAKQYFRQRFWTAITSAKTFLLDTQCWNEHMKLDPYTGGDPDPEIRVRSSEGFAAADYFVGNYWVWSKLIENLADVGYTPNSMSMEPYDWRLPFFMLEERDGYFTKLKAKVEVMKKVNHNRKVVLTAHSMGALVLHHFFAWVSAEDKNWVNDNIHTYINIAGCHLGVPKAASALLSGEMKDTVIMGPMSTVLEQFFGRKLRRDLWSSWGSLWTMLPKGGDDIWGQGHDICDDGSNSDSTNKDPFCPTRVPKRHFLSRPKPNYSPLISLASGGAVDFSIGIENATQAGINLNVTLQNFVQHDQYTIRDLIKFLQTYGSGFGPKSLGSKISFDRNDKVAKSEMEQKVWHDPTRTPLPYAPDLKIVCLYGTGLPTERAFQYKVNWVTDVPNLVAKVTASITNDSTKAPTDGTRAIADPPVILDNSVNDEQHKIYNGIRYSDGDGSVPLLSLGYMCTDAWQRTDSGLNPAGIKVVTREYQHAKTFVVDDPIRGGPKSSDHVDLLGNIEMTTDFIKIVTNVNISEVMTDNIVSNIKEISKNINKNGGIHNQKFFYRWQSILSDILYID